MNELVIVSLASGTDEARHHVLRLVVSHNEKESLKAKGTSMCVAGVPIKTFSSYPDAAQYVTDNR